ncbi:MAG TPA: hypothetical protein VMT85_18435 [Thermoanaerobaculia bacterium]|nr:hypothetical protein [Thermoanaerobaculia bacterium]
MTRHPKTTLWRNLIAGIALLAILAPPATLAQLPIDEAVRRIRELERQIEELLAALSPAERAEAQRRLAAGEEPPGEETAVPATPADPPPTVEPASRCRPLAVLDTNGDARVSGADRYWRHLYLRLDDGELVSLFELDIREVATDLDEYTTAEDFVGDVSIGDEAVFHLVGRRRGGSRGSLALDADGLRRGDGPSLVDAEGRPADGIQPLRAGDSLIGADGRTHPLSCDASPP